MKHELKTWPPFFAAVREGRKPFEVRRDDRGFAVGDELVLREWDSAAERYTGPQCSVLVTYIARGIFGIEPGFVVLGFVRLRLRGRS